MENKDKTRKTGISHDDTFGYTEEKAPISFVEDIPIDRETAIIDLATLQRLADNLAEADIKDIVRRFVSHIEQITAVNSSIEKYVKLLDDESSFHKTVKSIVEHNKK